MDSYAVSSQELLSTDTPEKTWSALQKAEHHELGQILQRTYLETFKSATDASVVKAADLGEMPLDELTDEMIELMRKTRAEMALLQAVEGISKGLKNVQEAPWLKHDDLFPNLDSFTRLWFDATKADSGGLEPGLEQALVTQLFLDVKTVLLHKDVELQHHVSYLSQFLRDMNMTDLDFRGKPRHKVEPDVSIAAHPHKEQPSSDVPEFAMLGVNTYLGINPMWMGLRFMYRIVGSQFDHLERNVVQHGPVALAHVQNALSWLRHVDLPDEATLKRQWNDIHVFVHLVVQQKVFVTSELPATLRRCSRRARLAMGAKATDFAINKPKAKGKAKFRPRGFVSDSMPMF